MASILLVLMACTPSPPTTAATNVVGVSAACEGEANPGSMPACVQAPGSASAPTTTLAGPASPSEPTTTTPEPVEQSGGTPPAAPPSTCRASSTTNSGLASWYGTESGSTTANGEHFDPDGWTTAHLTLPFGTRLSVCHGDACVVVRVTDRGPAAWTGRQLDLSRGAFAALAPLSRGVIAVSWEVV